MTIISPQEHFNGYVMRSFKDFKRNPLDDYLARTACMHAFHMYEVYFKRGSVELRKELGGSKGVYKQRLQKEVEGFRVVETVCDVSKHVEACHYVGDVAVPVSAGSVQSRKDFLRLENGGKLLLEDDGAMLLESSGTYLAVGDEQENIMSALEAVINHWKQEVDRLD